MPFDISITPPQLEIFVKPGSVTTQVYNITNNDSSPITLTSSIESWQASGTNGSVTYLPSVALAKEGLVEFSLMNSDLVLNQPFTIPGQGKQQLVLKIKAAPHSLNGDSYQTLFLTQINPYSDNQSAAATSGKIGSHILISISSSQKVPYQGQIINFQAKPLFKDIFFSPVTLHALVNNQGDFYFKTEGQLTITKNGQNLKVIDLNPANVAAHHSRALDYTINPPFWPGVYTATLKLNDPISAPPATLSFFVFPYYLTLTIFIVLSLIFTYIKIKNHRH